MRTLKLGFLLLLVLAVGADTIYRAAYSPVHRTDLTVYLAAAAQASSGGDIYMAVNPRGWPYTYPPFLATVCIPLLALSLPVASAVWYTLTLAAFMGGAGTWLAGFREDEGVGPAPRWEMGIVVAAIIFPLLSALLRGQATPLAIGAALAAVAWFRRGLVWRGGLSLGLAIAIKVTPALFLAYLAYKRRWRAFLASCLGVVLFLLLIPGLILGPVRSATDLWRWVTGVAFRFYPGPTEPLSTYWSQLNTSVPNNQSLYLHLQPLAHAFGWGDSTGYKVFFLVPAILILAVVAWALRNTELPRGSSHSYWLETSLVLGTTLLLSPVSWHHHYLILFPLIVACARQALVGDRLIRWGLVAYLIGYACYWPWPAAREIGFLLWGSTFLLATVVARLILERRRRPLRATSSGEVL